MNESQNKSSSIHVYRSDEQYNQAHTVVVTLLTKYCKWSSLTGEITPSCSPSVVGSGGVGAESCIFFRQVEPPPKHSSELGTWSMSAFATTSIWQYP